MPADFLMPLFVLTLVANAVLVAFAVQGMRRGQFDPDRPSPGAGRPPASARPGSEPGSLASPGSGAVDPTPAVDAALMVAPGPGLDPARMVDPPPVDPPPVDPPPPTRASTATRRRGSATGPATGRAPAPDDAQPAGTKRSRRRFSLPNLDDDHERVSRSIETFLGVDAIGGDGSMTNEDAPASVAAGDGATTVVLVAVAGLPVDAGRATAGSATRSPRRRPLESGAVSDALALVERTLRNAARGTDNVTRDGRGRFRIVMPSTGELAARAYLRRVRTTIEPGLETAGAPLRLIVATATVLDEPVEAAIRHASDRLSAALGAAASVGRAARSVEPDEIPDDTSSAPRAAGD